MNTLKTKQETYKYLHRLEFDLVNYEEKYNNSPQIDACDNIDQSLYDRIKITEGSIIAVKRILNK